MTKTTILFDAFELVHGAGKSMGIYNYALNIFRALSTALPSHVHLVVACNPVNAADFVVPGASNVEQLVLGGGAPTQLQRQLWMKWRAAVTVRRLGADVYFSPKGFLPGIWGKPRGFRSVIVVHDMIPAWYEEHHPGYFGRLEQRVVIAGLLRASRLADRVVTHTIASRDDICLKSGRHAGIQAIACGFPFVAPGARPVPHDYLFAVTSKLPHKNAQTVLDAYAAYRKRVANPLPLFVCGIADPHRDGVTAVSGLSDQALHGYYAHARAVVFLSLAEGFGYPPLETLVHGTPLVCSDLPIFHETTRGAALYADPLDPSAVADQMVRVTQDTQVAERLRAQGPVVARTHTWAQSARELLPLLDPDVAPACAVGV